MSTIAPMTTIAAAAVATIAMGMQVEASQMHPVDTHVFHHGPPGAAQVELAQPAEPAVVQAARVPPQAAPVSASREAQAAPCPAIRMDAGSALVRLPIRYLATWSAMAEALGFVAAGGDAPASLRAQLSGISDAAPAPGCGG